AETWHPIGMGKVKQFTDRAISEARYPGAHTTSTGRRRCDWQQIATRHCGIFLWECRWSPEATVTSSPQALIVLGGSAAGVLPAWRLGECGLPVTSGREPGGSRSLH